MELYRLDAEKRRAAQARYESEAQRRKEERDSRHRQYIEKETQAKQEMAKYNEAIKRQAEQQQTVGLAGVSNPADVSDATAFQIFLGLRPTRVPLYLDPSSL